MRTRTPSAAGTTPDQDARDVGHELGADRRCPALGGLAIQALGSDYQAMWLVCAAAILASIPFMNR